MCDGVMTFGRVTWWGGVGGGIVGGGHVLEGRRLRASPGSCRGLWRMPLCPRTGGPTTFLCLQRGRLQRAWVQDEVHGLERGLPVPLGQRNSHEQARHIVR